MKIEILDAIMGSGKTEGIIKWMCNNPQNKYLYVSPMLTEVEERIPNSCAELEFTFPSDEGQTKSKHLLQLLNQGRNISFTHSLFTDLSKHHLSEISKQGYILIIDEEVSLIEPYGGKYKKGDITSLERAGHIKVHEDNLGLVEWLWNDMEEHTQYSSLKRLCEINMLYCSKRERDMMVIQLPLALIESTQRTIILSYLFKGSVMESFLKLKGLDVVDFMDVEKDFSLLKSTKEVKEKARTLINFKNTPSSISVRKWGMSSVWWSTNATKEQLTKVGNIIRSVYMSVGKDRLLITLPKNNVSRTTDKNHKNTRCSIPKNMSSDDIFLYCGARATNNYAHKDTAVHAYNRYVNLVVKSYLQDYGRELNAVPDDDQYALSELIQWLWRTRIRNDQPIDVYILSERMEKLLKDWLFST